MGYKVNIQKLKAFCTPTMKYQKKNQGKNSIYYSNKKNKVPRNKPNPGGKRPVVENYRTLKKEIKEYKNKWKHILCS